MHIPFTKYLIHLSDFIAYSTQKGGTAKSGLYQPEHLRSGAGVDSEEQDSSEVQQLTFEATGCKKAFIFWTPMTCRPPFELITQ